MKPVQNDPSCGMVRQFLPNGRSGFMGNSFAVPWGTRKQVCFGGQTLGDRGTAGDQV